MDRIHTLLHEIYETDEAQRAYEMVVRLINEAKTRLPQTEPAGAAFSERDVILITYGDTLRRENEMPLATLHQFANQFLRGIVSTIHILPFYPYSSDDGFAVQDFYAVNPELGDWSHVVAMSQDFKLMFDAVFNHMSAQSDWFERFLAGESDYANLFMTESPETDLSAVTRPRATPLLTAFERADGETVHVWTTFSADQVDFDVRYPETLARLLGVLLFYIERGASIIRLDAIAYLWKEVGTSSIHLPQTHAIIRLMRAVLDQVAPQVILITETNVPHDENIAYFGDGSDEAQMVYNFTLPPLLLHTMLSGNVVKLRQWINTLKTPSDQTTFFNFTASHDGIGVRPVEGILTQDELAAMVAHVEAQGGRVSYKRNSDGSQSPYELNITYVDAMALPHEPVEFNIQRFIMSQAIAMSLAGVPAVYIHSLLGTRNDVAGMQASGQNRRINRAKLDVDAWDRDMVRNESFQGRVFSDYRHLLYLRTVKAAFHPNGAQEALDIGQDGVLVILRTSPDESQRILCVYQVNPTPLKLDLSRFYDEPKRDILSGKMVKPVIFTTFYDMFWIRL